MSRVFILFLLFTSINVWSIEAKLDSKYPEAGDIRCEKLAGQSLADLKAKLVENCDLNRPFSTSMTKLLNEETYFYCCQIKK